MKSIIKIGRDFFKKFSYEVKVDVQPQPVIGPNEYQCDHCKGLYTKGWTDEEAKEEAIGAFGFVGSSIVCDDCYNRFMYNRAQKY